MKISLTAGSSAMRDVLAGRVARRLDALDQRLQRRLVGLQVGREAALVADRGVEAALLERALQRVEDLGADPQARRRSVGAPTGTTMNSWKSTELSACEPPLSTFIIGTGRMCALSPPR